MSGNTAKLAAVGYQATNEAQKAVIESLTDDEVRVLVSVKERIDAAGPEVEGHSNAGGGWCW